MNKMCFLCASFAVILASYNHATAQVPKKKTDPNEKSKIVGTWRLIELVDSNTKSKEWEYPMGKNPHGYFTYTDRIVNLNICIDSPLKVTRKQAADISVNLESYIRNNSFGYFGTYEIHSNDTIVHKVKGGTVPYYIGEDQVRTFKIKGDTLTIRIWGDHPGKRVLVREIQ